MLHFTGVNEEISLWIDSRATTPESGVKLPGTSFPDDGYTNFGDGPVRVQQQHRAGRRLERGRRAAGGPRELLLRFGRQE